MPKIMGHEATFRIEASTAALGTALPIENVMSLEWDTDESIKSVSKGIGMGRTPEVYGGQRSHTFAMKLWVDNATHPSFAGSTLPQFLQVSSAAGSVSLSERHIQVRISTGGTFNLVGCLCKWRPSIPDSDGFVEADVAGMFEEIETP